MTNSNSKKAKSKKTARTKPKTKSVARKTIANSRATRSKATKLAIDPNTVRLVLGKGSPTRGGGSGGHYWHIYAGDVRAGHVYINVIDEPPFGKHASIQIHVNQKLRGRGIGRIAYRLACEQSAHDVVFAHMRKNNIASQRAAAAAGFEVVNNPGISQLVMKWTRQSAKKLN